MHQDESTTPGPATSEPAASEPAASEPAASEPAAREPWPVAVLGRRGALKAAAALAVAAVPVGACEARGGDPVAAVPGGREAAATAGPPRQQATTEPAPASGPGTSGASGSGPEITNGPRNRPNVALTFHGQGDPAQVRALLGELENGGARATVLAVGSWLDSAPELVGRILDGGHELGNHTQNHPDLASLSATDAFDEINACAAVLRRLTGSIGTWFRPSGTQYATPTIQAQAARVGYTTCLSYDLDSLDNTDPGPDAVVRTVTDAVGRGSIISMHCGHDGTIAAIPAILEVLRGRGLRPVTVTELVGR